jgi:hypothetical protein
MSTSHVQVSLLYSSTEMSPTSPCQLLSHSTIMKQHENNKSILHNVYDIRDCNYSQKFTKWCNEKKYLQQQLNLHGWLLTHLLQLWSYFFIVFVIFNSLLPMFSNSLYTNVIKFHALTLEHITKTFFQCTVIYKWHPHNDPLQGQKDSSWRVPDLGCEQDGPKQSIPFLW